MLNNNLVYRDFSGKITKLEIALATMRDGKVRIIVEDNRLYFAYEINGDVVHPRGFLRGIDKALAVKPGSEFRGWKRTKQYRLTDSEISQLVEDRIFDLGRPLYYA